jgi:hypothetical protein
MHGRNHREIKWILIVILINVDTPSINEIFIFLKIFSQHRKTIYKIQGNLHLNIVLYSHAQPAPRPVAIKFKMILVSFQYTSTRHNGDTPFFISPLTRSSHFADISPNQLRMFVLYLVNYQKLTKKTGEKPVPAGLEI